jgi:xanthine dehydrogenase accessory factor
LTGVQGSAPQKPGARLLVFPDGKTLGTVGGGCLEMETRRRALLALHSNLPDAFTLRLDDDFGWDDGLICGGYASLTLCADPSLFAPAYKEALGALERDERVTLATDLATGAAHIPPSPVPHGGESEALRGTCFVETLKPAPRLYVLGCGHVGAALVPLAAGLGFTVTAIDDRIEYASAEKLPSAHEVLCDDLVQLARTLPTNDDTYWVIVTRGHRNDGRVLSEVLKRRFGFVGMIGSRRKVRLVKEGLRAESICDEATLDRLHAPIGLDIGGVTPQEIALSIAAQLVSVRRRGH